MHLIQSAGVKTGLAGRLRQVHTLGQDYSEYYIMMPIIMSESMCFHSYFMNAGSETKGTGTAAITVVSPII